VDARRTVVVGVDGSAQALRAVQWAVPEARRRQAGQSACPVVVVRGTPTAPGGSLPVVVGIDGTPLSEAAIAFAFDVAAGWRAPLVAVHTWLDQLNDPSLAYLVDWQSASLQAEELLAERLAGWSEKYPDVPVQRLVARGLAGHALLDQAAKAQLVVVGSRGHGEIAGLLIDAVSNILVHKAACSVAIVRATD